MNSLQNFCSFFINTVKCKVSVYKYKYKQDKQYSTMCQLLGISSNSTTTPSFSSSLLSPFVQRGGNTDCHSHGWGLAYYNYCEREKKLRLKTIKDSQPAATSDKIQKLIRDSHRYYDYEYDYRSESEGGRREGGEGGARNGTGTETGTGKFKCSCERILESQNLLAHIRYATVGEVAIQNVHPFHRELFGVEFVFAHNGDVPMFKGRGGGGCKCKDVDVDADSRNDHNVLNEHENENENDNTSTSTSTRIYEPEGDTDSEQIFCYILNALHAKFDSFPSLDDLYYTIHELCLEISSSRNSNKQGEGEDEGEDEGVILNFLLGFGEYMFAYSWPGSRPGSTTWNGLYYMLRDDNGADGFDDSQDSPKGTIINNGNDRNDCCELGTNCQRQRRRQSQVAVIATKPLGPESNLWTEMERGDLLLFRNGTVSKSVKECYSLQ